MLQASYSSPALPETAADPRELRLTLPARTYLRLAVLSTATELVVRLQGPDGQAAEELPLPGGGVEPAHLSWITAAAGDYRWTVESRNPQGPVGAHALALEEERPAGPCDEARRRAERAVLAARRELNGPNPEAAAAGARALLAPAAGDAAAVGEREAVLAVQLEAARAAALREPGEAAASYERALGLARELGDRPAEAAALQGKAELLADVPQLDSLHAALELRRQLGDEGGQADLLYQLGVYLRHHGEAVRAMESFRQALELKWRNGLTPASTLVEIGRLYDERGDRDSARDLLDTGLASSEAAGDLAAQAFALEEEARLDVDFGELQTAYDEGSLAYKLLASRGVTIDAAWAASALATTLFYLGEPGQARQRYGEALSDFAALHFPLGSSYALLMIGSTYAAEHDPARALEHFQRALDLIRASGSGSNEGMALYDLGKVHNELHQPVQATTELERALRLAAYESPSRRAQILVELANAQSQAGDLAAAAAAFQRAVQLSARAPVVEAAAEAGLGRLERERGDLVAARSAIERALATVERLRAGVIRPDQRDAFLASRRAYYELYVDVLMRLDRLQPGAGHDGEALAASEQARARGLLDLLAKERVDLRHGVPEELVRRQAEIGERIARLQRRLWFGSRPLPDAEADRLKRDLIQAEEEEKELDGEIRRRQPGYAAVHEPRPMPLPEIQRLLDERSALIEFFVGKESSYLFVVTRKGLAVHAVPPRKDLDPLVERVRTAVDRESGVRASLFTETARELYRRLLLPAAAELQGKPHLIVAPDGPLYSLSFELLLTVPAPGGGAVRRDLPYLLRERSVSYVPSAAVLAQLLTERRTGVEAAEGGKRFVGFGDPRPPAARPLAAARDEVRRIASLFPAEQAVVFLGPDATEETVKTSAVVSSARYLHFATHGLLDERTPELSGLRLAPAGAAADDGLLQVRDVFGLELHAELVVLSACQTGLGKEVSGEGLIGMTRAFLYAGAAGVVVSLWQVDDESTSELMVSFYRHLAASGDKAEALRSAKLELIDRSPYFHPHYWAPFVLVGRTQ